jgi:hypothetical protein
MNADKTERACDGRLKTRYENPVVGQFGWWGRQFCLRPRFQRVQAGWGKPACSQDWLPHKSN